MWLLLACVEDEPKIPSVGSLRSGEAVQCDAPENRDFKPFLEAGWGDDWAAQPVSTDHPFGAGVAVADLDGDGRADIFLPEEQSDRLYLANEDGSFRDASAQLPGDTGDGESVSVADYDGDGDLDLYVGNRGPNQLLRNDEGFFTVVDAGVDNGDQYTTGSAWADIDGDDDLDLLVLNHAVHGIDAAALATGHLPPADSNALYRNDGDGHFTDITDLLSAEAAAGYAFAGGFPDLNDDGTPDLYVVHDMGAFAVPNVAELRDGSDYVPLNAGLNVPLFGMGLGIGDINNDEIPDILVPSWDVMIMMLSHQGAWYDSANAMGLHMVGERHVGWGGNLVDLENDGDLDVLLSFGKLWLPPEEAKIFSDMGLENPENQVDGLWVQEDGSYTEESAAWGLDQSGVGRGTAVYDINGDGYLDLVKRGLNAPARGLVANCGGRSWLEVELLQPGMNRFGIGAKVRVEDGDRRWVRWIHAGGRDLSTATGPVEHFGLDDASTVTLDVYWPDGARSHFEDVPVNQKVTVER